MFVRRFVRAVRVMRVRRRRMPGMVGHETRDEV
jgi:hypothetical protein